MPLVILPGKLTACVYSNLLCVCVKAKLERWGIFGLFRQQAESPEMHVNIISQGGFAE